MIRLMLKLLSVLLITVCGAPNGYVSAEPGQSIPAPTEPAWITRDNVNELNELDKEAFKAIDFFVLMAASEATLDPNRDPAEVELARKEALGLAVLATKYGSPKVHVGHFASLTLGGGSSMLVSQSMITPMSADAEWRQSLRIRPPAFRLENHACAP